MSIYAILHNIRSVHNVGAIFRTADGAGVSRLYLTGYTPAPHDRFGREVTKMKKTALGATETVPYVYAPELTECLETLRNEGVRIVAVEQHSRAIPYCNLTYEHDTAFIFGNEIEGVPLLICENADAVVSIPMHGTKESLNVGTAAGIILFDARRKLGGF